MIGPASLPRFEDRVLYHLVTLTGNRPDDVASGVSEADLALRMAGELHVTPSQAFRAHFAGSEPGRRILVAVQALESEGFVEAMKEYHPWTIWPTTEGRWEVAQWESRWDRERRERDHRTQAAILRALHDLPDEEASLDVEALCRSLQIDATDFEVNARRLLEQGRVEEVEDAPGGLAQGFLRLTSAGLGAVEGLAQMEQPPPGDPAVEVARLRERVRLAERDLASAIADGELRRRCLPMLQADPPYDRIVRTACFVLESRLRDLGAGGSDRTPAHLVEAVLRGPNAIRLGGGEEEQRGAGFLLRGVLELFRNAREGSDARAFSHNDALRFVGTIDLLLTLLGKAGSNRGDAPPSP